MSCAQIEQSGMNHHDRDQGVRLAPPRDEDDEDEDEDEDEDDLTPCPGSPSGPRRTPRTLSSQRTAMAVA